MKEEKQALYLRIKSLADWQKQMIMYEFLYDSDEEQLKRIGKEVANYEKINSEIDG